MTVARKYADRVKETTTTEGLVTIELDGTMITFQTFVDGVGTGETVQYAVVHTTIDEWEIIEGVVTDASPDTLTRVKTVGSSDSGAPVDFSPGLKEVFITDSATHVSLSGYPGRSGLIFEDCKFFVDPKHRASYPGGNQLIDMIRGLKGTLLDVTRTSGRWEYNGATSRIAFGVKPDDLVDNFATGGTIMFVATADSDGEGNFGRIITSGIPGWRITALEESGPNIKYGFGRDWSGAPGLWTALFSVGVQEVVAVTYSDANAAENAQFYRAGEAVTTSEPNTPSGSAQSDVGQTLQIGDEDNSTKSHDGRIGIVIMWDRKLDPDEIRIAANILADNMMISERGVPLRHKGAGESTALVPAQDVITEPGKHASDNTLHGRARVQTQQGDTDEMALIENLGSNGGTLSIFGGIRNPNGLITGPAGALLPRQAGHDSDVFINISLVTGDSWEGLRNKLPRGYIDGLITARTGDIDHDINFALGETRDDTNAMDIIPASAFVKQIDATFAEGTNLGGRDSADTLDINTTYHLHAIVKADGTVDFMFSKSATAPTPPAGFILKRRIGSVRTDGAANIIDYKQTGDLFDWAVNPIDFNAVPPAINTNVLISTPLGVEVLAHLRVQVNDTVANSIHAVDSALGTAPATIQDFGILTTTQNNAASSISEGSVYTNKSSEVIHNSTGIPTAGTIITTGYTDRRGKDA